MADLPTESHVPLLYGRSARLGWNRVLIGSVLVIVLAPFVLAMGYVITASINEVGTAGADVIAAFSRSELFHQRPYAPLGKTPEKKKVVRISDHEFVHRFMPVTVDLLGVGIAVLLWGMSSGTSANLLARLGARPAKADGRAQDALRILATLSASVELATPKLYLIQSSFPAVFSEAADARHAMVAVTTGALDLLDTRELRALVAHEICHILNRDSRLQAILNALATITEYPFKLFRQAASDPYSRSGLARNLAFLEIALSPLGLYIFFVSPILNGLIGWAILRKRETSADAEGAQLTGDPEALAYALAKIGGVVTVLGKSTVSSLPAHTCLTQRIQRLMSLHPECAFGGLEQAIANGKKFARERPGMDEDNPGMADSRASNQGRVYQLVSNEAVPVFDRPSSRAMVRSRMDSRSLVVVFDTPGKMRQANTPDEIFGYISREVKLKAVEGVLPQEVYDPDARAVVEEGLRREEALAVKKSSAARLVGLTPQQLWMAFAFAVVVFAGTTILLVVFAK